MNNTNQSGTRIRFLCVHQGAELYGSDRSFLQAVQAFRAGWPQAEIHVVLAADGPLLPLLAEVADSVTVRDLAVLRLAKPVSTIFKSSIALPWYLGAAMYDVMKADVVYINTTVIADYILAARIASSKAIIHAREIPKVKAMPVIRRLICTSGAKVIFNSRATANAFSLQNAQAHTVIHNGVDAANDVTELRLPQTFDVERPLRILMLGRINDWKGQDLLIDAIGTLAPSDRARVRVRLIGSTYRDVSEPIEALERKIKEYGLEKIISIEPFTPDTKSLFQWSDICAVPSRLPEPFGRVAIEAMAEGRPVLAANHGGLTEIVEEGRSGWLTIPNDKASLADAILSALNNPELVAAQAKGALTRFHDHFSSAKMQSRIQSTLREWVSALS